LNGVEVLNRGVPVVHTYQTLGADHEEAGFSGPEILALSAVRQGDNVIAVELHNVNATSSDAVWGGELTALGNPPTGPPVITSQPTPVTVNENGQASFSVAATGEPTIAYQWQRNTVNIPDATNSTLLVTNVHPIANGGNYRVIATNLKGTVTSTAVALTVNADTSKPTLVSAIGGTNLNEIVLVFSENIANYAAQLTAGGGALTINSATLTNGNTVILNTTARGADDNYTITINNVSDVAETANAVVANTSSEVSSTHLLLAENAVWRFDERNIDNGIDWRAPLYDDSAWSQGPGLFGVDTEAATRGFVINTPLQLIFPPGTVQTTTYYFRTHFSFNSPLDTSSVLMRVLYDDGIIVYLNGVETWRSPSLASVNPVTNATLAVNREGDHWDAINIGTTNIHAGDNVIAVELHQTSATSTDVLLGIILEALVESSVPQVKLNIRHVAVGDNPMAQVQVTWSTANAPGYVLVESATANGVYTPVAGNPQGTYTSAPSGTQRFFQLRKP